MRFNDEFLLPSRRRSVLPRLSGGPDRWTLMYQAERSRVARGSRRDRHVPPQGGRRLPKLARPSGAALGGAGRDQIRKR